MLTFFIAYLLCGVLIGFFAGLFGIGGGIIGIPALLVLFNIQGMPQPLAMHMAIGTLLATVVMTSIASIYSHYRKNMILLPIFKKIVVGTVIGSALGITISSHLNGIYLQRIFGLFLLFIAVQMLLAIKVKPRCELPNVKRLFVTTTMLGTVSGMLGLGGGILMVPYLNWCGISPRNAVATSAACILPATLVGTCGYMLSGVQLIDSPSFHSGFIYWPAFLGISMTSVLFAPLGVKVTHMVSESLLKKFFSSFLFVVGLAMLFRGA